LCVMRKRIMTKSPLQVHPVVETGDGERAVSKGRGRFEKKAKRGPAGGGGGKNCFERQSQKDRKITR